MNWNQNNGTYKNILSLKQKSAIINDTLIQNQQTLMMIEIDQSSLSMSQSSCSIQSPFQIYDYKQNKNQHKKLQNKKKLIEDEIMYKLCKVSNLKYMKQLEQKISQEQFMMERMVASVQHQYNMLQNIQKVYAQSQSRNNKLIPKQLIIQSNKNTQTQIQHQYSDIGINPISQLQKNNEQIQQVCVVTKNRILCQIPTYCISILSQTKQQTPDNIIDNHNNKMEQKTQQKINKNLAQKPIQLENTKIDKYKLKIYPQGQDDVELFKLYYQLQKQIQYMKYLKQNTQDRNKLKSQKQRVKFCMERYWAEHAIRHNTMSNDTINDTIINDRQKKHTSKTINKNEINKLKNRYFDQM